MRLLYYLRQARENPNLWWTLDSGQHLGLFEQLLDIAVDALDTAIQSNEYLGEHVVADDVRWWEALTGKHWDEDYEA